MASKPVNPARLPWLTGYTNEKVGIDESEFFHIFMDDSAEAGRLNLLVYKLFNECVPQYLSSNFHRMNISELSKKNSFINLQAALHFFLANNAHSAKFFKVLMSRTNDLLLSPNILIYLKTTRKFMKSGFELCTRPRDFILEPWILVQLPFQPSMLQQWLAAVYVEYLKFREQMAFFAVMAVPPQILGEIETLFLLQSLFMFLYKSVMHVMDINCKTSSTDEAISAGIEMMKSSKMELLISLLNFVTSLDFANVIDSLKRYAWNAKTRDLCNSNDNRFTEFCGTTQVPNMIYDLKFWSRRKYQEIFGSILTVPKSKSYMSATNLVPLLEIPDVPLDELVKLCVQRIIRPGWLKGVEEKVVPTILEDILKSDATYLLCQQTYYNWNLHTDGFCEFRGEDCGVITDIHTLFLRVVAAESLGCMMSVLRATRSKGINYYNAVGCVGPLLSVQSINDKISDIITKSNRWTLSTALADIKQCSLPKNSTQTPDLSLGFEVVAKQFEARIKYTAYMLYEDLYNAPKGGRKQCLELQVVHYLLPGLVAHFLELARSGDQSLLPQYATFLHHLMNSYDVTKCQYITRQSSITFEDIITAKYTAEETNEMLKMKSETIRKELKLTGLPQNVFEVIDDVFLGFTYLELDGNDQMWQSNFRYWSAQVHRFFAKVLHAIKATAKLHGNVPEQPYLFDWESSPLKQFLQLVEEFARRARDNPLRSYWQKMKKLIGQPKQGIAKEQLCSLLVYLGLKQVSKEKKSKVERKFASNACAYDPLAIAYTAFLDEDWLQLKQALAAWLNPRGDFLDPSLVTLSFAKANPELYQPLLQPLGRKMKIVMKKPGSITFFPIAHCRWCGLLDCQEFRVCQECQAMRGDYLDVNIFCSEKCENAAMKEVHLKEHELFLINKLEENYAL